jgi:hypothetical protein
VIVAQSFLAQHLYLLSVAPIFILDFFSFYYRIATLTMCCYRRNHSSPVLLLPIHSPFSIGMKSFPQVREERDLFRARLKDQSESPFGIFMRAIQDALAINRNQDTTSCCSAIRRAAASVVIVSALANSYTCRSMLVTVPTTRVSASACDQPLSSIPERAKAPPILTR